MVSSEKQQISQYIVSSEKLIMEEHQKLAKSVINIPGTIVNNQSSQLLVSSGIPSLDNLLGGGFPVGTVILIEEDQTGYYAKTITKYFLAEGVVNNHSSFVASQDVHTHSIICELPEAIETDPEPLQSNPNSEDKLKIAFRYNHLPTSDKPKSLQFGHHFDLTKPMAAHFLNEADIVHWKLNENSEGPGTFSNPAYHDLLQSVHNKIRNGDFAINATRKDKSILRIALNSLGSPMWFGTSTSAALNQADDLNMFIYCLRALVRSAFTVALVTIPSHLLDQDSINRCIYSSDIVFKLQSFSGTHFEHNPVLSDYQGYFHIIKFGALNSFVSKHPGTVEYTFKLRRKKFSIEKLHLPPGPGTFSNPAYHDLLQSVHNKIRNGDFAINATRKDKSILRIALNSLGSPMWFGTSTSAALNQADDLNMFIYCLRALVRSAFTVALVTIPSHLLDQDSINRCIYSSDIVFKLQSFSGTHFEHNPVLSDYQGYFHIIKFGALNSFVSKHPGTVEYTFKLRRKKFSIEKLHLPPDLEALQGDHTPTMGCGSSDKHLLEF